jgi:hypothetical protein
VVGGQWPVVGGRWSELFQFFTFHLFTFPLFLSPDPLFLYQPWYSDFAVMSNISSFTAVCTCTTHLPEIRFRGRRQVSAGYQWPVQVTRE